MTHEERDAAPPRRRMYITVYAVSYSEVERGTLTQEEYFAACQAFATAMDKLAKDHPRVEFDLDKGWDTIEEEEDTQ